jgi:ParB-like chromosome segregation protein Spo0J
VNKIQAELKITPLSSWGKAMTDEELAALAADIAANGLIDPIVITEPD